MISGSHHGSVENRPKNEDKGVIFSVMSVDGGDGIEFGGSYRINEQKYRKNQHPIFLIPPRKETDSRRSPALRHP